MFMKKQCGYNVTAAYVVIPEDVFVDQLKAGGGGINPSR